MFITLTNYFAFIILNEIVKMAPKFLELATGVKITSCSVNDIFRYPPNGSSLS